MKYCAKCGNQLSDNARFCGRCGTPAPDSARPPVNQPTYQPVSQPVYRPVQQPVYQPAYQPVRQQPVAKKPFKWWIPVVAVAAVAALILGAVLLIGTLGDMFATKDTPVYSYSEDLPAASPTAAAEIEDVMPEPEETMPVEASQG